MQISRSYEAEFFSHSFLAICAVIQLYALPWVPPDITVEVAAIMCDVLSFDYLCKYLLATWSKHYNIVIFILKVSYIYVYNYAIFMKPDIIFYCHILRSPSFEKYLNSFCFHWFLTSWLSEYVLSSQHLLTKFEYIVFGSWLRQGSISVKRQHDQGNS